MDHLLQFTAFKAELQRMTCSELIKESYSLFNSTKHRCTSRKEGYGDDESTPISNMRKSDIFWMILEKKIVNTFSQGGLVRIDTFVGRGLTPRGKYRERTPGLLTVLDITTPKEPPFIVLRTLLEMCQSVKDYCDLVNKYPACLKIKTETGDSILHRVVIDGGYRAKETIHLIIRKSLKMSVDVTNEEETSKDLMFGGLARKDSRGRTPLTLIFGHVAYHVSRNPFHERWVWLTTLIQKVVHIQLYHCNKNTKNNFDEIIFSSSDDRFSKALEKTPLLHAALEIGCPMGLLNRILYSARGRADFRKVDGLNRTPLAVALSNKETPAEIVIALFKQTPADVLEKLNADKDQVPLHRIINTGIKYNCRNENELVLIGTIVEKTPQVLDLQDNTHFLPPFMLSCINNVWSLDVVYGLLRTAPQAIEPYIHHLRNDN